MKPKGSIIHDGILLLYLYTCIILIYTKSSICEEWCRIASNGSENRYEQCLPDGEDYATYNIDVTLSAPEDHFISGDVTLKIIGDGKETKPITIASANGTLTRLTVDRCDVGDLRSLGIHLNGSVWSCEKITIFKDSKYWIFDCLDDVNPENEDNYTTFLLSGNKTYIITIQTGNLKDSGTSGSIGITLLGVSGKTNNKILGNSFYSESYLTFQIKAADVGELNGVILSNSATSDPWYCESVRVMLSDKTIVSFPVKRWIGKPFDSSVKITTEMGTSISSANESTPIDIECSTRSIDIFPGVVTKPFSVVVRCPMNCQVDDLVHIEGTSIHPSSTSICGASLLDSVISPSGGDVVVSITQPLKKYFGSTNEYGLKSQEYEPPANQKYFSFFTFLNESIDNIDSNVRLVDAFGKLTSFGRLEVLRNGRWGSVCNKGKYGSFNNKAATLVCVKLGFKYGIHISENCSDVNNQNLCAPPGYNVSYSALRCNGNEDDISKCIFEEPTVDCRTHKDDVIIKCTNYPNSNELDYGTLRLVDATGALSSNGMGRLEFYNNGFGSVCNESWDKNAEKVACLEMGFSGINNNGISDRECSDLNGTNFCAPYLTKISAVNFKCNGTERYLKQCSHESNDNIYCTHSQDVIISCEGDGDPSEHRNRNRIEPFIPQTKKFNRILNLTCYDNILSHSEFKGPIGKFVVASCPQNCMNEPSAVNGTFIYTNESPICKSAIHSGIIDNNGGRIVVINAAGQSEFYGSSLNGITSLSAYKNVNALESSAFMVSRPTHYIISKHDVTNTQVSKDRELGAKRAIEEPFNTAPCKFEWYPGRDWKGFNGKSADYINTKDYPGARMIKVFKNATFIVETTPTGGIDKWNTIFSFQNCGGLTCAIDNFGELILQENCNAYLLRTGFSPIMGKRIVIAIIYYSLTRDISIFVDGKLIVNRSIEFNLNFQGDLIIGKSVDTDTDYFIGQITLFRAFDYVLTPEQIRQQYSIAEYDKANHNTKIRMTTGGNVCLSRCTERDFADSNNVTTNPAISLTCKDTIENERFNGHTGKTFLVSCTGPCFDPNIPLRGSKIYTSDSSICKAAIHSGAIPKEGGEAIVVIMRGLSSYTNCHGHYGITSQKSNRPYLRSFVVHKAPQHIHMSCIDNAIFVLNMHPGSRLLLHCPPGCRDVESDVFGADIYNPVSSLCRAAIHSGKLDNNGGEVEIEVAGEQKHFYSSEANGILSQTSGQYLRSFKILRATSKI